MLAESDGPTAWKGGPVMDPSNIFGKVSSTINGMSEETIEASLTAIDKPIYEAFRASYLEMKVQVAALNGTDPDPLLESRLLHYEELTDAHKAMVSNAINTAQMYAWPLLLAMAAHQRGEE